MGASAGDNPSPAKEQGYVYLPETVTIEGERADYGNMQLIGDSLYYLTRNGEEESVFTSDAGIWLYDADGKFLGNVPYSPSGNARTGNGSQTEEIQVKGTFCADDGKFYVCLGKTQSRASMPEQYSANQSHADEAPKRCALMEVDFEKRQLRSQSLLQWPEKRRGRGKRHTEPRPKFREREQIGVPFPVKPLDKACRNAVYLVRHRLTALLV